jgi:hypothetical protein
VDLTRLPAVVAAFIALGCAGSATMSHDELASKERQLHSLDAEEQLAEEVIAARHVPRAVARGHARYLLQSAHEHVQQLAQAKTEPGDEPALVRARANATRLEQRFVALILQVQ